MIVNGEKTVSTHFEGRGALKITIERIINLEDKSVPVACRIIAADPRLNELPDDRIYLDDIADLQVLADAINDYLAMMKEQEKKGGAQ